MIFWPIHLSFKYLISIKSKTLLRNLLVKNNRRKSKKFLSEHGYISFLKMSVLKRQRMLFSNFGLNFYPLSTALKIRVCRSVTESVIIIHTWIMKYNRGPTSMGYLMDNRSNRWSFNQHVEGFGWFWFFR